MQILNEQEVGVFLVAASASRYRSLYHLAIVTGMRISELRGLSWADVDWQRGTITVKRQIQDVPGVGSVAGAPKTHSGTRAILLGESTLNKLRGQKSRTDAEAKGCAIWQENDLIFPSSVGTPFAKTDLQRDFWKLLEVAGLRRIRFHDLRHTAASLMLNHGVPALVVSKILGHANASITLTIYAHSALDMQTGAAGIMDEIVTPIAVSIPQLQPIATNRNRK
jgi:integrase